MAFCALDTRKELYTIVHCHLWPQDGRCVCRWTSCSLAAWGSVEHQSWAKGNGKAFGNSNLAQTRVMEWLQLMPPHSIVRPHVDISCLTALVLKISRNVGNGNLCTQIHTIGHNVLTYWSFRRFRFIGSPEAMTSEFQRHRSHRSTRRSRKFGTRLDCGEHYPVCLAVVTFSSEGTKCRYQVTRYHWYRYHDDLVHEWFPAVSMLTFVCVSGHRLVRRKATLGLVLLKNSGLIKEP